LEQPAVVKLHPVI